MPGDASRNSAAFRPTVSGALLVHFCLLASAAVAADRDVDSGSATAGEPGKSTQAPSPGPLARLAGEQGCAPADDAEALAPFRVPERDKVELWRLPVGRLVVVTDGPQKTARVFPINAEGRSLIREVRDPQGECRQALAVYGYHTRNAVEGPIGDALVEFPLTLPEKSPVQLRAVMAFFNPFGQGEEERLAEPVVWRVRVRPPDTPFWEALPLHFAWHSNRTAWQEAVVDLSDYAGRTLWLQLTVPPTRGHRHVHWVEPTLLMGDREAP